MSEPYLTIEVHASRNDGEVWGNIRVNRRGVEIDAFEVEGVNFADFMQKSAELISEVEDELEQ